MNRISVLSLVVAGIIFPCWTGAAQENNLRVDLYVLAEHVLPPFVDIHGAPTSPPGLVEYKLYTYDGFDHNDRSRSPDYFDVVAAIANKGERLIGPIEIVLTRDRKIGETYDWNTEPHPSETAEWEGSIPVETKIIDKLDGLTLMAISFGPFSRHILFDGVPDGFWPWEIKHEVAVRCSGCSSTETARARALIKTAHAL